MVPSAAVLISNIEEDRLYDAQELQSLGFNKMALRRLVDRGVFESPARGIYIKAGGEPHLLDDHLVVAKRAPNVIFNLYTAAKIHGITQFEPMDLWIGLPPGDRNPPMMGDGFLLDFEVLRWTRPEDAEVGIETISLRGVELKLTNPERTVVDMWRYSGHNPSLRLKRERITDENLLQCVGAYLDKNDGRTAALGQVALNLKLPSNAFQEFVRFIRTYAGGYSANRVF